MHTCWKEKHKSLLVTSKTSLEVDAEKTKHMLISCAQNAGQNLNRHS